MRFIAQSLMLALISMSAAMAAELPQRKPGLWEVKTSIEGRDAAPQVIQQCIDATTDQMMQSSAGPFSPALCKREVQTSGNSTTIDSTCAIGGKTSTAHAAINGSFDSAYTMTVTSQGATLPGGKMIMTIDAKRLGPCKADQKSGDMIMSNGSTINILEAQKHIISPNVPVLPPQ
jgi:hypothetical protein